MSPNLYKIAGGGGGDRGKVPPPVSIFMLNLFTGVLLEFWKQRECICSITFLDLTSLIKSITPFNEIPALWQSL